MSAGTTKSDSTGAIMRGPAGIALFGPGGESSQYRYALHRDLVGTVGWDMISPPRVACLFLMLNPSTATASINDPTIRRCIGFAMAWGCTDLHVANLFAFRSTDPAKLRTAADPVGPMNDGTIKAIASQAEIIVCAWGTHGTLLGRDAQVRELLAGYQLKHLGLTKGGHPKHPLYLPNSTVPSLWKEKTL